MVVYGIYLYIIGSHTREILIQFLQPTVIDMMINKWLLYFATLATNFQVIIYREIVDNII